MGRASFTRVQVKDLSERESEGLQSLLRMLAACGEPATIDHAVRLWLRHMTPGEYADMVVRREVRERLEGLPSA